MQTYHTALQNIVY